MSNESFLDWAYMHQSAHFGIDEQFPDDLVRSWLDENSVDYYRHTRSFEFARLIASQNENSYPSEVKWLTVGDGRLGLDSARIKKAGFINVYPTDLSPFLLKKGKDWGVIDEYGIENAEKLSFADDAFDWSFCKETLHHLPRPYQAIYELLRVSSLGIVIIEPNDCHFKLNTGLTKRLPNVLLRMIKKMGFTRPLKENPVWENSGNYVYSFNKRDLLKIAYGLNLPCIAFKGINDHYIEGCEFQPAEESNPIFCEIRSTIEEKDKACRWGLSDFDMTMAVFFKDTPHIRLKNALESANWEVVQLQQSPLFG
jgi:SAM-dependent methyltransferase